MVGLGLMGHGIAQTAAASGYQGKSSRKNRSMLPPDLNRSSLVVAMDQSEKAVDKGVSDIRSSLEKMCVLVLPNCCSRMAKLTLVVPIHIF